MLSACAVVDQYSGRAVSYNTEAEQAQNKALLLNIVRASLRRPMQFTTLQSISGTASVSGTTGLTIPLGAGGAQYKTWPFSGTMSGGPQFVVPVLDTQDFYRGILTPISGQLIDLYLHSGYPPQLLFNLVIKKIVITKDDPACPRPSHWSECELVFDNLVSDDIQVDSFQLLVGYLSSLGLSTELFRKPDDGSKQTKAKAKSSDKGDDSDKDPLPTPYVFCFEPRDRLTSYYVLDRATLCGSSTVTDTKAGKTKTGERREGAKIGSTSKLVRVGLQREFFKDLERVVTRDLESASDRTFAENFSIAVKAFTGHLKFSAGPRSNTKVTLHFYTRSPQNLIYFLGEIVRRETRPEYESKRVISLKGGNPICAKEGGSLTTPIFAVETNLISGGNLSVEYEGTHYSIPDDYCASGRTTQVLDMTRQLLAVSTSSKALPQSGIISVVSTQ
jgi:hypothetical protein